ncbi:MAG: DUF459 domain-containing protein [Rhizobiaceae bacterium]
MSILAGASILAPSILPMEAWAQERVVRRSWSLFDIFAPRRSQRFEDPAPAPRRKANISKPRKPKARVVRKAAPAAPEIVAVEKLPDARPVLVIGDFLASGLAEGLTQAFSQNASVRVLDRSKGSSGFVRDDVVDWPKEIAALVETEKPAAIIIMLGSNDRQQMLVDGKRQALNSEPWVDAYEERTTALAAAIKAKKIPFVWVSMPPFKSTKMSSDMVAFNDIYKAAAQSVGGEFVDIWDGFADESGAFVATGPDVNGQPVRLRSGDGINLTTAGKAKVAFYSEKPLRKLLGLPAQDGVASPVLPLSPGTPAKPKAVDRTDPIALNDPNLDGATELLGAPTPTVGEAPPVAGPAAAPVGRADNFMGAAPAAASIPPAEDESTSTAAR